VQEKKIFMVQGHYPIIRRLLRARGWVEWKPPSMDRQLEQHHGNQKKQQLETQPREDGDEQGEASYLVRNRVPNFIWTNYLGAVDRLTTFSKQEGLCLSLQNLPWIEQADPNTFFPRCYLLGTTGEREAFIDDFRLTAARSLLKLALEKPENRLTGNRQPPSSNKGPGWHMCHDSHPMPSAAGPGSPVYPHLVEEALEVCEQHLGVLGHQDIDRGTPFPCRTCIDWDRFLHDYYCVAHEGARLALSGALQNRCQELLQRLEEQLPQLSMEGKLNVWILKPGAESQGRGKAGGSGGHTEAPHQVGVPPLLCSPGIVCATRLEEVLRLARGCTALSAREGKWVVQKYVERLLTIFGTKFDIRQWFVVTDWKPLTKWYKTSPDQDPRVPPDRIWSSKQFQAYLGQLGQADAWHQVMVPSMKAAILSALRSAQDQVGFRKGSFELYGADFLVGQDCQPWLLEINSNPTMSPSSAVTRRLCANVQRDTLRLVLDYKDNPTCSTGAFELIYKE
ncbi:TTLL3 monoglycylase, partial [Xiphorhynchus elegans]|nr:TTLL3 monoglycylase [Xiphorhynchus elegans]